MNIEWIQYRVILHTQYIEKHHEYNAILHAQYILQLLSFQIVIDSYKLTVDPFYFNYF